ncbi:MAG: hypothetical protein IJW96_05490 [Clostridia bacterium]|nr:hypothetical protein [Clostridia bacterium]
MNKRTKSVIAAVLSLCMLVGTSCVFEGFPPFNSDYSSSSSADDSSSSSSSSSALPVEKLEDMAPMKFADKNKVKNAKKANIVTSFIEESTNYWNYIISVGYVNNVPLSNLQDPKVYHRYKKQSITQTYSYSTTFTESKTIQNSVENTVETCTETGTETTLESKVAVEAGLSVGIDKLSKADLKARTELGSKLVYEEKHAQNNAFTNSYEEASSYSKSETFTREIQFDPSAESGYYGYCLSGTVEVFAYVVYDPATNQTEIEFFGDVIAQVYSFDYLTEDEYFDMVTGYSFEDQIDFKLPELEEPTEIRKVEDPNAPVRRKVTVSFDPGIGYMPQEGTKLEVFTGNNYGALPTPKHNDQYALFVGWQDKNGTMVDNNSICGFTEDTTLTAQWIWTRYWADEDGSTTIPTLATTWNISWNWSLPRDRLLAFGYTKFHINVEYTLSTGSGDQQYDLEVFLNEKSIKDIDDRKIGDGGLKSETFGPYDTSSCSNGNNTVKVAFLNNHWLKTYKVSNLKVKIIFEKQ